MVIPRPGDVGTVDMMTGGQTDGPPIIDESDESSYTKRDVLHYHYFGRRGVPITTRVTKFSWQKNLPFVKPVKVAWKIPLSEHALLRLLYGYKPLEMSDKWFVYADGPDATGKVVINFIRSWLGQRSAELVVHLAARDELGSGLWIGEVVELTFEGDEIEAERIADTASKDGESRDGGFHEEAVESSQPDDSGRKGIDEAESSEPGRSTAQSPDVDIDERGETWAKFLVATACRWVLHIDVGVDIPEPKRWTKLACERVKSEPINQTTYMGSSMPQETIELLQRLGPGTIVTFS
jgi:hypothetical protein